MVWSHSSPEESGRPNHLKRQWCAQFRQVSSDLQVFYLTMPNIQESWSRTDHRDVFDYYIKSRASKNLIITVHQAFEVMAGGVRPFCEPIYSRDDVVDEHRGRSSWSLKTKNHTELSSEEFHKLYLKYKVGIPDKVGLVGSAGEDLMLKEANDYPNTLMHPPIIPY